VFSKKDDNWKFEIKHAENVPYDSVWLNKLNTARDLSEERLSDLSLEYG
jgi:hypothetical protein